MKKILKVTVDGKQLETAMDSGQMLERFDDMFNQFAHQCVQKTSGYQGCIEEFEDFKQIAQMKAIEKFETYDLSKDANFSTLLFKVLREQIVDIIRKNESQMRKLSQQLLFIDAPIGESGDSANEIIADTSSDRYFVDETTELEKYLINNLSKEEMIFYTIDLKKQVSKASSMQKVCLQHTIESFLMVAGDIPDKKEDLAVLLGMSRPTLNKRIKETVNKVKDLATEFCLSNMPLEELPF